MRRTVCFVQTKHDLTSVGTSGVNTVEYGVLVTHVHCMNIFCICQSLVFGGQYPENKFLGTLIFKGQLLQKIMRIFCSQFVSVLEKNERDCWFQHYGATASTA
jgi:hypothetical protein